MELLCEHFSTLMLSWWRQEAIRNVLQQHSGGKNMLNAQFTSENDACRQFRPHTRLNAFRSISFVPKHNTSGHLSCNLGSLYTDLLRANTARTFWTQAAQRIYKLTFGTIFIMLLRSYFLILIQYQPMTVISNEYNHNELDKN